jgi:hypothetical protein
MHRDLMWSIVLSFFNNTNKPELRCYFLFKVLGTAVCVVILARKVNVILLNNGQFCSYVMNAVVKCSELLFFHKGKGKEKHFLESSGKGNIYLFHYTHFSNLLHWMSV